MLGDRKGREAAARVAKEPAGVDSGARSNWAVLSPPTRLDSALKPRPSRSGPTNITPDPNHTRHAWAWGEPAFQSPRKSITRCR